MFTNKKSFWLVSKEGCTRSRTELSPRHSARSQGGSPVPRARLRPARVPPGRAPRKAGAQSGPRRRARPGVWTVRVPSTWKRTRSAERDPRSSRRSPPHSEPTAGGKHGARRSGPQRMKAQPSRGRRPRPPPWELGPPRGWAATRQCGRSDAEGGGGRGTRAGGAPPPPIHPRPPARARAPSPSPSPRPCSPPPPEPNSSRRGRAPRSGPTPSSNHKTSPQLQQLKLRSHRAAPGAPPRTESGQLGTFAAERNNGRPLPRRTAGGCSGGGEERGRRSRRRLSAAAGSALALRTARARRRMRYRALLEGRATPGGRGGLRGEPRAESWDCLARLSVKFHGTNRKTPGRCAQVAKGS